MFNRTLTDQICVHLAVPFYAEPLFQLTDDNRSFLRRWLPWLDVTTEVAHSRSFLVSQLDRFAKGEAVTELVFYNDQLAGVAGFHTIDAVNQVGTIGYWLAERFNGNGIMTRVVSDLVDVGRQYYSLNRVEIRCATENERSRAIPERLGFAHEGTLRQAERIYERWYDMEIYGLSPLCDQ